MTAAPFLVPAAREWIPGEGVLSGPVARAAEVRPDDPAVADRGPEAWAIDISPADVRATGASPRALARASVVTEQLRRLHERRPLECGRLIWWPDHPIRGLVLDVGRRFVRPPYLRDLMRHLAWNGLNTLVVHLNDNEITSVSGRDWSQAQRAFRLRNPEQEWACLATGDAYTPQDWASFEDLAASLGIDLVPEIDTPAHSRALIDTRPDLAKDDTDFLDLANPDTLTYVRRLLSAFAPWFRSPALHVGADEYDKRDGSLYADYLRELCAHVRSLGRRPWVWGSLSGMGVPADGQDLDAVMCCWNDDWYGMRAAVEAGFSVVNCHDERLYVVPFADYYRGHGLDVADLYATWEPHLAGPEHSLTPGHPKLLGAMAALWNDCTEEHYDEEVMLDMILPALPTLGQKTSCTDGLPGWPTFLAASRDRGDVPDVETAWAAAASDDPRRIDTASIKEMT